MLITNHGLFRTKRKPRSCLGKYSRNFVVKLLINPNTFIGIIIKIISLPKTMTLVVTGHSFKFGFLINVGFSVKAKCLLLWVATVFFDYFDIAR